MQTFQLILTEGLKGYNGSAVTISDLENIHPEIQLGGRWHPLDCTSRNKVAIIIPYRDREQHLILFLQHMHPYLQKQQLDYGIYVVEMVSNILAFCILLSRAD